MNERLFLLLYVASFVLTFYFWSFWTATGESLFMLLLFASAMGFLWWKLTGKHSA